MKYNLISKKAPEWDLRFCALARHVATWSKDAHAQSGAVVFSKKSGNISVGYTGYPMSIEHASEQTLDEASKQNSLVRAEVNALIAAGNRTEDATIYTWGNSVDAQSAGLIIQSGIKRVVAFTPSEQVSLQTVYNYPPHKMLLEAGIELDFYTTDNSIEHAPIEQHFFKLIADRRATLIEDRRAQHIKDRRAFSNGDRRNQGQDRRTRATEQVNVQPTLTITPVKANTTVPHIAQKTMEETVASITVTETPAIVAPVHEPVMDIAPEKSAKDQAQSANVNDATNNYGDIFDSIFDNPLDDIIVKSTNDSAIKQLQEQAANLANAQENTEALNSIQRPKENNRQSATLMFGY